MGGINTLGGLNKVSVDYRPTVELIKPKTNDSNRLLPEGGAAPQNVPQPQGAEAKRVVQQLDLLLLRAAGKSISADIVKNINTIGTSLITRSKGLFFMNSTAKAVKSAIEALTATEMRLDEAIKHAEKLFKDGKVYGNGQWRSEENLSNMKNVAWLVEIKKSDGTTTCPDPNLKCVKDLRTRECPSLYKREKFHETFIEFQTI